MLFTPYAFRLYIVLKPLESWNFFPHPFAPSRKSAAC